MELKIEYVPIDSIKPYKGNAKKHPKKQIEQIKQSIIAMKDADGDLLTGFKNPLGVWHNEIATGHGRYIAAKELGFETIPIIRLDSMTDEQRRAYIMIDNQLTLNTENDLKQLAIELESIKSIDMPAFSLDLPKIQLKVDKLEIEEANSYYGDEREKTYKSTNFDRYDASRTDGFYDMPVIRACDFVPDELIGFNYAKTAEDVNCGVHFFIDDYQFERVWNRPDENIERLKRFQCVLTPDFSLYMDMPMALKVWNVYRSRLFGQMCQDAGMNVIPTLSWAEPETYSFCFDGIQSGGTVAVSTVGVMRDKEAQAVFCDGLQHAIDKVKPKTVVLYGTDIDFDFGKIKVKKIKARQFGE